MLPRLKAEIWVKAHIRRCFATDMAAFLRHRGEAESGAVLLKINRFEAGCELLEPTMSMAGGRAWMRVTGPEPKPDAEVEAMIERRLKVDPDIWVLEVEDPHGRHVLDEPVV